METMNRLSGVLDKQRRTARDADIQSSFRSSAIALTHLLKTAQASVQQSYDSGYADALQDVLEVILQTGLESNQSGISNVIDWIEARQDSIRSDASEAEGDLSDDQPGNSRKPNLPRARKSPQPSAAPSRQAEASTSHASSPPIASHHEVPRFSFTAPTPASTMTESPIISLTPANANILEQRKRASPRGKRRSRDNSISNGNNAGVKRKWWEEATSSDSSQAADITLDDGETAPRLFSNFHARSVATDLDDRPSKRVARR